MKIRQLVQDGMFDVLAQTWNEKNREIAAAYGVDPFELDFAEQSDSPNVMQCNLSSGDEWLLTDLIPPGKKGMRGLMIYTTQLQNKRLERPRIFSGDVVGNLDFYYRLDLRDSDLAATDLRDTESIANAVEDTLLTIIGDQATPWPSGMLYAGTVQSSRSEIQLLQNGFEQRIPFQLLFEVHV